MTHPDIELFYSDEDKIDEHGRRYDAFFKPDWSPDLFRSCNYICHFVVMKRSLLDRSADWTKAITALRTTNSCCAPASTRKRSTEFRRFSITGARLPVLPQSAGGEARGKRGRGTGLGGASRQNRAGRAGRGSGSLPLSGPLSHCGRSAGQYSDTHGGHKNSFRARWMTYWKKQSTKTTTCW